MEALAGRLGVTGRHLRRLFTGHLGVGPAAVESARRLHLAKALLHQTRLPVGEIAFAAGYGSLRRFNEAFLSAFDRPPSALRREVADGCAKGGADRGGGDRIRLALAYRPAADGGAFDWSGRLAALPPSPGVRVQGGVLHMAVEEGGALSVRPGPGRTLGVELAGVPVRHLARAVARVKRAVLWDAPAARPLRTPEVERRAEGRAEGEAEPLSRPRTGSGRSRTAPPPSPAPTSCAS